MFTFDNKVWKIMPNPGVNCIIRKISQDNTGTIWVLGSRLTTTASGQDVESGIWSYKQGNIDKIFFGEFGDNNLTSMAIDSSNNIWVAGGGIYRYDGQTWEHLPDLLSNSGVKNIVYDKYKDVLYLNTAGYEANIYTYQDGKFEPVDTEGIDPNYLQSGPSLHLDNQGNLWVGTDILYRFDVTKWIELNKPDLIYQWRIADIVFDDNGRTWFAGTFLPQETGLATYDGKTWNTYPTLKEDPRLWWRQKDLAELYKYPTISVDINEIRNHFLDYKGKKISVVGDIQNAWINAPDYPGPSSIFDVDGNNLWMFTSQSLELNHLLQTTNISNDIEQTKNQEYVGYLEPASYLPYYSQSRTFYFYITEIYPSPTTELQKSNYQNSYEDHLNQLKLDKKALMSAVDQWISAKKSGSIEELKQVFHPESQNYKNLFNESYNQWNPTLISLDITYNRNQLRVEVDQDTARIYLSNVVINPSGEMYHDNYNGYFVEYHGPMIFKKDSTQWKVIDEGLTYYANGPPKGVKTSSPSESPLTPAK